MTVRRAEERDADRVLELLAALGRPGVADDPTPQRGVFVTHLRDEQCSIFVAEEPDEAAGDVGRAGPATVAGVASLWLRPRLNWTTREAWIPDLFVDPVFRRRGLARELLDACAAEARRHGCHRLVLESGDQRSEAHSLYSAYGFGHYARAYELPLG